MTTLLHWIWKELKQIFPAINVFDKEANHHIRDIIFNVRRLNEKTGQVRFSLFLMFFSLEIFQRSKKLSDKERFQTKEIVTGF